MTEEHRIVEQARAAQRAARLLARTSARQRARAVKEMAKAVLSSASAIMKANARDVRAAQQAGLSPALVDRLVLNEKRIRSMHDCLVDTARLPDPIGEVLARYERPNGLVIEKVRVPLGVVGIIYESRPNVTSDCAGLCIKSGNAVILKGGKEAFHSNQAIHKILTKALSHTAVDPNAVQWIDTMDRKAVAILLQLEGLVDVIIPRGGEGLIRYVAAHSKIPVIKHYKGVCHTYVGQGADLAMAEEICFNAKVQRPGVCNAMETMLVHEKVAPRFIPRMIDRFLAAGVRIRGCEVTRRLLPDRPIEPATDEDWSTEYLDLILAVKIVKGVEEAVEHINRYGSHHSDAIVTRNKREARFFLDSVDSACVYHNASTRFTDGYEFGFGAEVGISTDKIHARGPMGLEGLTTYKYEIYGQGQIRQ